jgi:hypothetical protein
MDFETVKFENRLRFPRNEGDFEWNDIRSQIARVQPLLKRLGQLGRQENTQWFRSAGKPRGLDQHWQASRVIGVSMREEKRIECPRIEFAFRKSATAGLPGVDKNFKFSR